MAGEGGRVVLSVQVEVPIRRSWEESYAYDRLLGMVRMFQEDVKRQFGVSAVFDLIQEWPGGNVRRRECPHMVPGQESDSEVL
jgi:hypothetical protein